MKPTHIGYTNRLVKNCCGGAGSGAFAGNCANIRENVSFIASAKRPIPPGTATVTSEFMTLNENIAIASVRAHGLSFNNPNPQAKANRPIVANRAITAIAFFK